MEIKDVLSETSYVMKLGADEWFGGQTDAYTHLLQNHYVLFLRYFK